MSRQPSLSSSLKLKIDERLVETAQKAKLSRGIPITPHLPDETELRKYDIKRREDFIVYHNNKMTPTLKKLSKFEDKKPDKNLNAAQIGVKKSITTQTKEEVILVNIDVESYEKVGIDDEEQIREDTLNDSQNRAMRIESAMVSRKDSNTSPFTSASDEDTCLDQNSFEGMFQLIGQLNLGQKVIAFDLKCYIFIVFFASLNSFFLIAAFCFKKK